MKSMKVQVEVEDPIRITDDMTVGEVLAYVNKWMKRLFDNYEESFGLAWSPREIKDEKWNDFVSRWVVVFPVTGGSEGHYIHIDTYGGYNQEGTPEKFKHIALCKTFNGLERAQEICRVVQFLLSV